MSINSICITSVPYLFEDLVQTGSLVPGAKDRSSIAGDRERLW